MSEQQGPSPVEPPEAGPVGPGDAPRGPSSRWSAWQSAVLAAGAAGFAAAGFLVTPRSHLGAWAVVVALLLGMTALAGRAATGRMVGALIDRRNKLSLSRLQLLLWTILVGSGLYVAGMINVTSGQENPLQVNVPASTWALVGIGMTSFVGAPIVQGTKLRGEATPAERSRAFRALADRASLPGPGDQFASVGRLVVNRDVGGARVADLLTGEEVGDAAYISLGKLQLAFATLIGLVLYAAALAETLGGPAPIRALPGLDNGLVTLLGISHAGYLAQKAAPHSQSSS